jgi:hypothetical protein
MQPIFHEATAAYTIKKYQTHRSLCMLVILILVLMPGAFSKFYVDAESLKEGLLVATALSALIIAFFGLRIQRDLARLLSFRFSMLMLFLIVHGTLLMLSQGFNGQRFVLSLAYFAVVFLLWLPIIDVLFRAAPSHLDGALRLCYWILLADGLASSVMYLKGGDKTTFFAAEPSLYAIIFLPFMFFKVFRDRSPWHLVVALFIAILIKNLTILCGIVLLMIFYFRRRKLTLLVGLGACALLLVMSAEYSTYITDRLALSSDSENLSTLAFLSGYERAYETVVSGHLLGVGFQQMGIYGPQGKILDAISEITRGNELNLYDGSTLASKIIVEFGALGVLALLAFLLRLWKHLLSGIEELPPAALFFTCVEIAFASYLFVRGMGYTSPTVMMLLASYGYANYAARVRPVDRPTVDLTHSAASQ